MLFQEIDYRNEFDGIWACASLLHVSMEELPDVLGLLARALKDDGILYVSFKYGEFCGEQNGRAFTDLDEESFRVLIEKNPDFSIQEQFISIDVRPEQNERWLNAIVMKQKRENSAYIKAY